jgi:hypothetical protein
MNVYKSPAKTLSECVYLARDSYGVDNYQIRRIVGKPVRMQTTKSINNPSAFVLSIKLLARSLKSRSFRLNAWNQL